VPYEEDGKPKIILPLDQTGEYQELSISMGEADFVIPAVSNYIILENGADGDTI